MIAPCWSLLGYSVAEAKSVKPTSHSNTSVQRHGGATAGSNVAASFYPLLGYYYFHLSGEDIMVQSERVS